VGAVPADVDGVISFSVEVWLVLAGIGVAACLAMLHVLASVAFNESYLHDLRVDVIRKRNDCLRELYGLAEDSVIDARSARRIETVHQSAKKAAETLSGLAERAAA
jgi:hypothetical protein